MADNNCLNPLISGARFDIPINLEKLSTIRASQSPYQRGTFRPRHGTAGKSAGCRRLNPLISGARFDRVMAPQANPLAAAVSIPLSAGHVSTRTPCSTCSLCLPSQSPYQRGTFRPRHGTAGKSAGCRRLNPLISGARFDSER